MTSTFSPRELIGTEAFDSSGEKIGKVGTVYVTDEEQQPKWVTVKTGFFGNKETFVPLEGARNASDGLHVMPTRDAVKGAPQVSGDGHLDQSETDELYRYYEIRPGDANSATTGDGEAGQPGSDQGIGAGAGAAAAPTPGRHEQAEQHTGTEANTTAQQQRGDRYGAGEGNGQDVVRSEERMTAGTERVESGRARLRKYVVTEQQNVTVPVSHEEVRVEREPISETERDRLQSSEIGEEEQEVVLHEERPTVHKDTVPVERVHLDTETVTEEQTVSGELQKERVEVEDTSERGYRGGEQ